MTAKECIEILKKHPKISIGRAKALTGLDTENVKRYAAYAGIEIISASEMRDICAERPYSCFHCPFEDCIGAFPATTEETAFVNRAFGSEDKNDK